MRECVRNLFWNAEVIHHLKRIDIAMRTLATCVINSTIWSSLITLRKDWVFTLHNLWGTRLQILPDYNARYSWFLNPQKRLESQHSLHKAAYVNNIFHHRFELERGPLILTYLPTSCSSSLIFLLWRCPSSSSALSGFSVGCVRVS